ncbi:MAG TPA: HAMP domain-containing sensor histidine kinase [Thermodesulfobacteriota bacterium]
MAINPILHDLATALTLAGAEARRLADGEAGPLEPAQADVARQLAARIEGLMRLVRMLLEEQARGEPRLDPRPASLRRLAAEGVDAARPLATARGVEIVLREAVEGADALVGYWDADSLRRVIVNVLDNAIKYTPAGGRIDVSVDRDGRAALLAVRDTGAGVAADEIEAVFEPGRRGSAAGRLGAPGLGLGLATSRAIVAAHGGRIWLESNGDGQGTAAMVRLPLDRRRAPRGHGRWPARVDWGGGQELAGTVETLSRSGAAVRLSVAPPVGALVALRISGLPADDAASAGDDEVAAIGRVVRILEEGHASASEGRPAGAPDPREPIAAIAFAEVGPGTGARLDRAVAAAATVRATPTGD